MNGEKKQLTEMGMHLKNDRNGSYRSMLQNRVLEIRRQTEEKIKKEADREALGQLEAMMRALTIATRILEKLLVENPDELNFHSHSF
jgi:hypothetical protein